MGVYSDGIFPLFIDWLALVFGFYFLIQARHGPGVGVHSLFFWLLNVSSCLNLVFSLCVVVDVAISESECSDIYLSQLCRRVSSK
jgi:hypothetical protein